MSCICSITVIYEDYELNRFDFTLKTQSVVPFRFFFQPQIQQGRNGFGETGGETNGILRVPQANPLPLEHHPPPLKNTTTSSCYLW